MNNANTEEDFKLIRAYQNGEREALNQLIKKYYEYIYKVFKHCKKIPDFESQKFTQDICIRFIKSLKNFKFKCSFKHYLDRAINNRFIDYIRPKKKLKIYSILLPIFQDNDDEITILDKIMASRDSEPDRNIMYQELKRIIEFCLSQIKNKKMQQVVNMWLHRLKRKQIASLLKTTIGYVNGTLERGKAIFRQCVIENYPIY